ncbi:glycogen debranching N-terminal domain-containing protein [Cellulomonas denverensis]|uniref:Amylo-alpha-1,6-glucosidase n=1 Tax=Cellulomonas denverensis TaxID=264297 RepID=A0A7X6KWJ7_9CELL|nr:glycogen debranching N-terminal domain-containing protein [Cellulomonas denverensis]NKY23338.1 amylo-alpha-1,6-glucosidase [Cellulomonas denverensis]GIG24373.1 amylo-alpha-1,6-glucosidase [Cellulomonas denverensis]
MELQPLLHDLLAAVHAPTQAWSAQDGQIRTGVEGVLHGDVRVLSAAVLTVDGAEPEPIGGAPDGTGRVRVTTLTRGIDAPGADPTARLDRLRTVLPGTVTEELTLSCSTPAPVTGTLTLRLRPDGSSMDRIKAGLPPVDAPAVHLDAEGASWSSDADISTVLTAPGADLSLDGEDLLLRWTLTATTGAPVTVSWSLAITDANPVVQAPADLAPEWSVPQVTAADRRLPALLDQSLTDLASLRMTASFAPQDVFLAAGAPWFFTLFGRDSIWAARMLLPLGTELAAGTLRTLAVLQGEKTDPATAEQPGKILHEVRRATLHIPGEGTVLPPVYYGTVDATALWICLLHDAWRWGMPADQVEALLPHLERALAWMSDHGAVDGFLAYRDETGTGLANQGWKDSGDSVQWRTGELAEGPIALAEVQGYAHEAAIGGATLLDAFGRDGGDHWRGWAADLAERFRAAFWVEDDRGRYPGIALDAHRRVVDTVTSNIGHLLGTGILTAEEEATVAARLLDPAMDSGYGLRTMAEGSAGFWPLRYHGGAVWPHDTAIVIQGLARAGHATEAATLAEGLLAAAGGFDQRLPELYSGDRRGTVPAVLPYPAACRPQAWSAASSVAVLTSVLGLRPDAPAGTLEVAGSAALGALEVRGLRFAGAGVDVQVDADGRTTARTDGRVRVRVGGR